MSISPNAPTKAASQPQAVSNSPRNVVSFVPPPVASADLKTTGPTAEDRARSIAPFFGAALHPGFPGSRQRAPTISDSAVGYGIRERRRAQGRTQKEVARLVGVTGAQLHRYETGATRIAASRLIAIADALGVTAHALISAGVRSEVPPATAVATSGDDIVELIQLFSSISDPKHRSALLAVARMMVGSHHETDKPTHLD